MAEGPHRRAGSAASAVNFIPPPARASLLPYVIKNIITNEQHLSTLLAREFSGTDSFRMV
jgi:hypothetical protein